MFGERKAPPRNGSAAKDYRPDGLLDRRGMRSNTLPLPVLPYKGVREPLSRIDGLTLLYEITFPLPAHNTGVAMEIHFHVTGLGAVVLDLTGFHLSQHLSLVAHLAFGARTDEPFGEHRPQRGGIAFHAGCVPLLLKRPQR